MRPCAGSLAILGCGLSFGLFVATGGWAAAGPYFAVKVVDAATGRGVPLVELRTVNEIAWWTDSAGLVALDEPGLFGTEVFLHVQSPGYEYPPDMFGNRGLKVTPTAGGMATVPLKRLNVAERLYRVTGAGIYRDSHLLGLAVPTARPLLNGLVAGQDTVVATPYRGKIYWFWGDTGRVGYPLGNFGASGATSEWPGRGGLDPDAGVDFEYFVDATGFSRPMVPKPDYGMRWVEGPVTVKDEQGEERLVTRLAVQRNLGDAQEWHLLVFDDARGAFESVQRWELRDPHQSAHPFRAWVGGVEYVYLFPEYRVPAALRSMRELRNYEAFTCVAGDGRWRGADTTVERDESGRVRFSWKAGADRLGAGRLQELLKQRKLRPEEYYFGKSDFATAAPLRRRLESVTWNDYRRRWIGFFADKPGEAWFAEADTPLGPWAYARQVATHGAYNFYNLAEHSFLARESGRRVYFEGTYTDTFSDARARTPRYDYNQIMYRLDLADERLELPVAVYRLRRPNRTAEFGLREQIVAGAAAERVAEVAWFALPPATGRAGTVPVYAAEQYGEMVLSLAAPADGARPLFSALPAEPLAPGGGIAGTWQCRARADGEAGEGLAFVLELRREGERVEMTTPKGERAGSGRWEDGRLAGQLMFDGVRFDCQASFAAGRFDGTWRKSGTSEKGTWSGTWKDPTPPECSTAAVVGLRRFRRTDGETIYAAGETPPPDCALAGPVLCRVWKAPHPLPPMDWQAKPWPGDSPVR